MRYICDVTNIPISENKNVRIELHSVDSQNCIEYSGHKDWADLVNDEGQKYSLKYMVDEDIAINIVKLLRNGVFKKILSDPNVLENWIDFRTFQNNTAKESLLATDDSTQVFLKYLSGVIKDV